MNDMINLQDVMKSSTNVLTLIKKQNVKIRQVNGQRILNGPPPDWEGPPPDPGCEIFVGKIPRDIYEDQLYEIFGKVGRIYEMRLMMDFSGNTRGYCFVMYATLAEAESAINVFNNLEIVPGRRIGVVKSINNCRLCIGQLSPDIPSIAVIRKIYSITDEVESVAVYRTHRGRARYSIINYKSHRGAAMARRRLVPERTTLFGNSPVTVDWSHPDMQPCNAIEDIGFADKNGEVHIRRSAIGDEGKRTFTSISRIRKETLDHNIKTYVQEEMSLPSKHSNKLISAPECSNPSSQTFSNLFPRLLDVGKPQLSQFNLFNEFTFSLPNSIQEDQESSGLLEQLRMGSQNGFPKENCVDEVTSRFSKMNLQPEEGRTWVADPSKIVGPNERYSNLLQDKRFPGQWGKIVGSFNQLNPTGYQPVICPEKGFSFHQTSSNVLPYIYTQLPGICVIPPKAPFVEPWLMDNHSYYYNQHHCFASACAECCEEFVRSNAHRVPEPCSLNCCNQHLHYNEAQSPECTENQEDLSQQSKEDQAYQHQIAFKGRQKKQRAIFEKSKSVRKISMMKVNSRRRNHSANRETAEGNFAVQPEPIPKGARPILSAKK